jgi:hypothetical protein
MSSNVVPESNSSYEPSGNQSESNERQDKAVSALWVRRFYRKLL